MSKCIIIQSGDQINSQYKPSPPIAITPTQDTKDFQMPDDMFNNNSFLRQLFVESFFRLGQHTAFRFFQRRAHLRVQPSQTLITAVRQAFRFSGQTGFAVFIKRKIVSCSFGKSGVDHSARALARLAVESLSCGVSFCPNNTAFVFFRTLDFGFRHIHHDDFHIQLRLRHSFARQGKLLRGG